MTVDRPGIHSGQRRLARVQVVNWGTFHGHHDIPVSRKGFLLTGASGSGKSTLIDAISAVLMPVGSAQFNAAAQESGRSGRTLITYVRGAWRREAGGETDGLVSSYLRPGATWSAVALTYRAADPGAEGSGQGPVTLVKLMHLARGANSPSEVKSLHLILDEDVTLTDFEPFLGRGIDSRGIRKRWPTATVNPSYSPFSAAFRKRLGIGSQAAQQLLHRTLSAKSLGSLDQLFRDYMLDEPDTFDRADRAVTQFRDLREAHRLVVDARRQVDTLDPLTALARSRADGLAAQHALAAEDEHLDAVHARLTRDVLGEAVTDARARLPLLESAAQDRARDAERARDATVDLRVQVGAAGGGQLEGLRGRLDAARTLLDGYEQRRAQVASAVAVWDGQMATSAEEFANLCGQLEEELRRADADRHERRDRQYQVIAEKTELDKRLVRLVADRELLAARRSNLDPELLRARESLCRAAGIAEDAVAFGGELVAVREEHTDWTGPIERVLGGFGRTLLVPRELYPRVAAAVEATHLGARLVYRRVQADTAADTPQTGPASLVRRLEVRSGPLAAWVHRHLAERYDYACVESVAELPEHPRAVTRAGQVRHSAERHEKDDRRRIDDPRRWVLGFDNEAKLVDLRRREAEAEQRIAELTGRLDAFGDEDALLERRRDAARTVLDRQWADIDTVAGAAGVADLEGRLARWQQDNPEHSALTAALAAAEQSEKEASAAAASATAALDGHRRDLDRLLEKIAQVKHVGDAVPAEVDARITARFRAATRSVTAENIDRILADVRKAIGEQSQRAQRETTAAEKSITGVLTRYLAEWGHTRTELRGDPDYVDDALAVLARLRSDGLPEYEERFFELLSTQSVRNIGELTNAITKAPREIRARIDPVNESLRRSPFDTGRTLRIDVRDRRGPAATQFLTDLRAIVSGGLTEDDRAEAERRFELMAALLDRLGSGEPADVRWRRQVLDTRQHVGFIGVEVDDDGVEVNFHDSSSGLSGGQAQKLVFFCLAAALRYQLAADGADVPRYGTVILDEAFDKADPQYTRRALDVFELFGFHMVLATPLKLLSTLEEYIGGVATVSIRENRYSQIGLVPLRERSR